MIDKKYLDCSLCKESYLLNEEDRKRIVNHLMDRCDAHNYIVADHFKRLPAALAADKEIEEMMRKIIKNYQKKIKILQ